MSLKLPSNSVPFTFYRVAAQTGGLYRAAQFDLLRRAQPTPPVFSVSLEQAMAEDDKRNRGIR